MLFSRDRPIWGKKNVKKPDDILGHIFLYENVELLCSQKELGNERKKTFADSNIGICKGQCSLETRFESS